MKILLSAGHGANDPGAIGNGYRERDLNRDIVLAQKKAFSALGHEVHVRNFDTNEYDEVLNLKLSGYDLVISNHLNSSSSANSTGTEVYISSSYPRNSKSDAEKIQNALVSTYGLSNRGVKQEDFRVVYLAGKAGSNAVLIEHGFISNSGDVAAVVNKKDAAAEAVAKALSGEISVNPSPGNKEIIEKRWSETGSVNFTKAAEVYSEPNSTNATPIVEYFPGEVLNLYVECVQTNKYLYLKYNRAQGGVGYLRYRAVNSNGSYGEAVGTIPNTDAPVPTPEKIIERYPQTGSIKNMSRRAPVYSQPNSSGQTPIVWYEIGEALNNYSEVVETDKYVYVKYSRNSGGVGYLQVRTKSGNSYGSPCGTIV